MLADIEYFKLEVEAAIEKARSHLLTLDDQLELPDYHATVVGCIITAEIGLFFHVGDGLGAAVYENDWQGCTLTLPANGEFSDQTYFYTQQNWQHHLRFSQFDPQAQYIILMSDGTMSFAAAKQLQGLESNFFEPVSKYLEQNTAELGVKAVESTLDSQKTYRITTDDKTLLWAKRQ